MAKAEVVVGAGALVQNDASSCEGIINLAR